MTRLMIVFLVQTVVISTAMAGLPAPRSGVGVADLRCEYLHDPVGIDVERPRLSWKLESRRRGQKQTAYQVLVAGDREILDDDRADLWDTGKVDSDRSIHIEYSGRALASRTRCYWKVRVWDKDGKPSPFSDVAVWEMGLLAPGDWQARWISAPGPKENSVQPAPLFRKLFLFSKRPRQARIYICGLGYHELRLNGEKVGDHVLDPAFTRYDKRVLYVTYDVTDQLKKGWNALGVILGNGWYNMHTRAVWNFDQAPWRDRPVLLCQLEVTFADGSKRTIATDGTWHVATGPIVFDSIRNGETYDARLEKDGWDTADCDDADWPLAAIDAGPKGALKAQMMPPIKVTQTIEPVKVTEPKTGIYVFDMGQNMAGRARLKVSGPAGTKIVMKYGERLHEDGTVDQQEIGQHIKSGQPQTDTYILKGRRTETWEPRFVYHGFQYVEVTGLPGKPNRTTLQGRVAHTAFEKAGTFACSNELFNRIQKNTLWSYVSNFHGYPTDCPHREKNGWTGDAHLAAETGLYNFHSASAYAKWMDDFKDEQRDSGELPGIVPTGGWGYQWGNGPAWDSAYVLIPWYLYEHCGDTRVLAEHYDRLKRYVDYLTTKAEDHIVSIGLGDWAPAKSKTPENVTSTGYYYRDALIVSQIARLLGKSDEARKYGALALKIREAFNKAFYHAETGLYDGGTQTAMSCALYHGLVPPQEQEKVAGNLVAMIEKNDGHLDAGILGTKYLIDCLTAHGRADVVYEMATRTTYPSWGRWLEQGATTLWEQWDGNASRNHIMFGHISAWFYQTLAGIQRGGDAVAFKHIVIKPQLLGDIEWVKAEHESMYGAIKSAWEIRGDKFRLEVTIPANATATVYVPSDKQTFVTEGPDYIHSGAHVRFVRLEDDYVVFDVGSGTYEFTSMLP